MALSLSTPPNTYLVLHVVTTMSISVAYAGEDKVTTAMNIMELTFFVNGVCSH
jgi:hypothetical protein